MSQQRIVVGVDGTASGRAALRWAVEQAADGDGDTVLAIAAWRKDPTSTAGHGGASQKSRVTSMLDAEVKALPEDARARIDITSTVSEGTPGDVLVEACEDADLLVLGRHGHGKMWHMMFGWTSEECIRRVNCPVVIIPTESKAKSKLR